jgi:N-acetyl sugar amidotransferase
MKKIKFTSPKKVLFCKKCVLSNQKPVTIPEFKHTINRTGALYMNIDKDGICDACKYHSIKYKTISWNKREKELKKLLNKFRKNNGEYDCLIPGSGGKDSAFTAHILKYKYGMNPLTITWPPILYTDYGYKNFKNWLEVGGFDNISFKPNPIVQKKLTKLSIENLLHPFQTFILGQKNLAPKIAFNYGIDLIFYGESEAEYGAPIKNNTSSLRAKSAYVEKNINNIYLSGIKYSDLIKKFNFKKNDLDIYLPISEEKIKKRNKLQVHYLGYYLKWIPQENYYYSVENCGFKARPFRTQGTFQKFQSIDDKIDDLHYYTSFIKFGLGRTSHDAAKEVRNKHITLHEGKKLVEKFDGEFPDIYLNDVLKYLEISKDSFIKTCDNFRQDHLWKKTNSGWKLRHTINKTGTDD